MNKIAAFLICICAGLLVFGLSFSLGISWNEIAVHAATRQAQKTLQSTLQYMSEGVRNDLLQGNYRQARNALESMKNGELFDHYFIIKDGQVIEASGDLETLVKSRSFLESKIDISFSSGGPKWGTIIFLSNRESISGLERTLEKKLWLNSIGNALASVFMICILFLLFWRSGASLHRSFEKLIRGDAASADRMTNFLWKPLLSGMSSAAKENIALQSELSTARMKEALFGLASRVAHDIRSPLQALQAAVGRFKTSPDESQALIEASIRRINGIADDLLDKHRGGGRVTREALRGMESGELKGEIEAAIDAKRAERKSSTQFSVHVDAEIPQGRVSLSALVFSRILSNLMNNSMEADSKTLSIYLRGYQDEVSVTVADDGRGIPPEVLERMNMGEVVSSGTGNGLGLAQAREALSQAGGRMEIVSRPALGTMVTLTMPVLKLVARE